MRWAFCWAISARQGDHASPANPPLLARSWLIRICWAEMWYVSGGVGVGAGVGYGAGGVIGATLGGRVRFRDGIWDNRGDSPELPKGDMADDCAMRQLGAVAPVIPDA